MTAELHRWTQDGRQWACGAYDHGPFCRLCQDVTDDEAALACLANVDAGLFGFVGVDPDGDLRFTITDKGKQHVELMIEGNDRAN